MKKRLLSIAVLAVLAAPSARAMEWSDNAFRLWYSPAFNEPGIDGNVAKTVLTFTHASGYKFGGNFLNVDALYSSTKDPVQGVTTVTSAGALEVYTVYRHSLSFSKLTGSKVGFLFVRDVSLELGVDFNTKNNAFAARKIMPIGGPQISIDVPGFWNIAFMVNKEWNTNAILGKSVEFDVTPTIATAWGIPVYGPITFEGFGSVNFPKGKDGFGADTVTEVLIQPKLMVDVGAALFQQKGWQLGVGFQYWLNKFGGDHEQVPGSYEKAFFGQLAIHL